MNITAKHIAYFSATGTTKKITERIAGNFTVRPTTYDLFTHPLQTPVPCASNSLLIVGMPVYAGRVPAICVNSINNLTGNGTPAIAVVVYGNRDYDDALLELVNMLTTTGFNVMAAAAFVAQHAIFNSVGAGRPDPADMHAVDVFSTRCLQKLQTIQAGGKSIMPKGNFPYRPAGNIPFKPTGNDRCTECGNCVDICPTHAISAGNPRLTNAEVCITCCACISVCPEEARGFHFPAFGQMEADFRQKNSVRKEPEFFM